MMTRYRKECAVVRPQGQLDLQGGIALTQALKEICSRKHSDWVVDLTDVDLINSAGLTALINAFSLAIENQCRLTLYNPSPAVRLVFEITRLDELFEFVEAIEVDEKFAPDLDRDGETFGMSAA
ncbi:MAG: STAS domain-containing protein [Leptolyngbyaceae cyanobacterium bins.302]|nr:STAS domain-containing protein [Leptolyngbyaceae cyanobacterium bins.302]